MLNDEIEKDLLSLNATLKQREEEYLAKETIKVFSGTYNLCGKNLDESLLPWFCLHDPCDLYVMGFQELCELSTSSVILNNDWVEREAKLTEHLEQVLRANPTCKKLNLKLLRLIRLWGIVLIIYVKADLAGFVSDISMDSVATGILNALGNKGSVAISFKLYETRLCFLSSHLASDTEQLERRNADYRYTLEKLRLYSEIENGFIDFDSHGLIIWLGDFNYRLNNLSLEQTRDYINKNEFDELIKYDQLTRQLEERRVFLDFQEGKIRFKPTYKYIAKTDNYDIQINANGQETIGGRGSNKVKLPSWTDRILWKASENTSVKLAQYSCVNMITISDHKPVYAIFNVDCKRVDVKKKKEIYDSLLKESDRKKNEERPRVCLITQPPELNFGKLSFYQKKNLSFTVRNDGKSLATVDTELFISDTKLSEDQIMFINNHFGTTPSINAKRLSLLLNEWFKLRRSKVDFLKPGREFTFEITNLFKNANIGRLNRKKHLDDIIIVKCQNGNELFVNVCCEYVPSIMGVSLKTLSCLDKPFNQCDLSVIANVEKEIIGVELEIDKIVRDELDKNKSKPSGPILPTLQAIRENILLQDKYYDNELSLVYGQYMDYLIKRGESLHQNEEAATKSEVYDEHKHLILESLSSGLFEAFNEKIFDFEILLEVLCDLLNSLPTPLIPRRFFDLCMVLNFSYVNCLEIVNCLPKCHSTLFSLILKFIHVYSKNNEINYNSIAKAIFQVDSELSQKIDRNLNDKNIFKFLKLFLDNYDQFRIIYQV